MLFIPVVGYFQAIFVDPTCSALLEAMIWSLPTRNDIRGNKGRDWNV